jgi:hypothetical protein
MMGKGNAHINQMFGIDHLIQDVLRDGVTYSEELDDYCGSAEFYGRDVNGVFASVYQDGPDTARVYAGSFDIRQVTPRHIPAHLSEFGFECNGSLWHKKITPLGYKLPPENPGYIYLMRMDGTNYYKVGISKDTKQRVKQIGILLPKPVTVVYEAFHTHMKEYEAIIHKDWAVYHTNGEWFELDAEREKQLVEFMKAINQSK